MSRAPARVWLDEEDAPRPELTLVVTRTDEGRRHDDPPRRRRDDAHRSRHDEPPRRDPATGRRTVTIRGQASAPPRRRPGPATRVGSRPDRIALWAFLMGLFLVFVATATADAAPL